MNIYVGNLSYDVTEDLLNTEFSKYGAVESVRIIIDKDSGRSKGFGFVEMPSAQEAQAAMTALNGTEVAGRAITVNEAKPKQDRPRSGGRGGFGGGGGGGFGGGRGGSRGGGGGGGFGGKRNY
jgi:RNA recognition motif-containing protein